MKQMEIYDQHWWKLWINYVWGQSSLFWGRRSREEVTRSCFPRKKRTTGERRLRACWGSLAEVFLLTKPHASRKKNLSKWNVERLPIAVLQKIYLRAHNLFYASNLVKLQLVCFSECVESWCTLTSASGGKESLFASHLQKTRQIAVWYL